jgi:hypothetical protein
MTLAVVFFRDSQVFQPVVFGLVDFFPRRFAVDFRAGCFLEDGSLAGARFFAALRLADFLVAAMAVSRLAWVRAECGNPAGKQR